MIEDLKKIFSGVTFKDSEVGLGVIASHKGKSVFIDLVDLVYMPITHLEFTGKMIKNECECCGQVTEEEEVNKIIDVKVEDLTEKQKEKQREAAVSILKKLKIS